MDYGVAPVEWELPITIQTCGLQVIYIRGAIIGGLLGLSYSSHRVLLPLFDLDLTCYL
jgi:hypothetical protein